MNKMGLEGGKLMQIQKRKERMMECMVEHKECSAPSSNHMTTPYVFCVNNVVVINVLASHAVVYIDSVQ